MNITEICNPLRVALKRSAFAVTAGAWLAAGTALAAPANDNFADAIALTGVGVGQTGDVITGTQTGTNTADATLETGEPKRATYGDGSFSEFNNTVWFKWVCPEDGTLRLRTVGSRNTAVPPIEWDAVLGVFSGSAVNALTPLGTSPQDTGLEETLTVPVTAGVTYRIQLAGYVSEAASNILLDWNFVRTIYEANILTFGPGATIDEVNNNTAAINWPYLYGLNRATLAPTFTLSPGATCNRTSGAIPSPNFSAGTVTYTVTAAGLNPTVNVYTVTAAELPVSTECEITSFGTNLPGSYAQIVSTGGTTGTIFWTVPAGSTVADLAPSYTLSPGATCIQPNPGVPTPPLSTATPVAYLVKAQNVTTTKTYSVFVKLETPPPVAGYSRWFDASQITGKVDGAPVTTWNDLSANAADATVPSGNAAPVYVANAGTQSGRPAVYFPKNGGPNNSGALRFTRNSAIRTVFSVFKGNSFLLTDAVTYDFHRPGDDSASQPLWDNTYVAANIKNGSTYVNGELVTGTSFGMPTDLQNGFNLVEVLTTGNVNADSFNKDRTFHAGNQSHAELLIYDRVLTEEERLSVERYLTDKWLPDPSAAEITAFGPGATIDPVDSNAATINWTVPYGTNLTTLAPTFTMSSGATCTKASGSPQNFTGPVTYTVKSLDTLVTNIYTVFVTVTPISPDCDITSFGPNAAISGTDIVWYAPAGSDPAAIVPIYTVSPFATGVPASGTPVNFTTNPRVFTITAQNGATQQYSVTVTVAPEESTLLWEVGTGTWDLSSPNWRGQTSGLPTPFFTGDNVIFNKTTGGTVTITAGMAPLTTTVNATSGTYSFGGGPLAAGSLTKSGAGILTMKAANTYPSGTLISGGRVTVDTSVQGVFGTGTITLNSGGILELSRQVITNPVVIGSGGGRIAGGNSFNDTLEGPVTLNGLLTIDSGTTGSHEINGDISGVGGITKVGGTWSNGSGTVLRGTNTYTGATRFESGKAQVTKPAALGGGDLYIGVSGANASTTQLNLNYTGTKTVDSLTLGGVAQTIPGTYGSTASGATVPNDTFFIGAGTVTLLPGAKISVFGANVIGSSAAISPVVANAATIAYTVPFGTNLATLAPTFTASFGATCTQTNGGIPTPNFSTGPVVYTVTSSDSLITNAYTVTVNVAPASTAKTLSNLYFTGSGYPWETDGTGLNLKMVVSSATNVTALAPTFNLPLFATCDFPSGTARDFTTAKTYTVTAQDGSTQAYTVTVQKIASVGSGSYQQKVLASGPVSYWPLNEASGTTAFDLASGLNNITYGGTLTLNQPGLRADGNPSVQFTTAAADPDNTRVAMNSSLNPREFTVECWVKPTDSVVQYLVSIQDRTTASRTGFALWRNNGAAKYGMQIGTGPTTTQILNSTSDVVVGKAAHVVATYDGTTLRMYVNGVLENSLVTSYQPVSINQPGFTIASRNGITAAAAQMQDVALYTRALTLTEIQNHIQIPFAEWSAAYAGGQGPNEDFNNDGVQNGIAYFMGATGATTNPGLNASNTVTWPASPTFRGTYEVQTSPTLSAWTDVTPRPLPVGGNLSYTLPSGLGKQFVRLFVTPTP